MSLIVVCTLVVKVTMTPVGSMQYCMSPTSSSACRTARTGIKRPMASASNSLKLPALFIPSGLTAKSVANWSKMSLSTIGAAQTRQRHRLGRRDLKAAAIGEGHALLVGGVPERLDLRVLVHDGAPEEVAERLVEALRRRAPMTKVPPLQLPCLADGAVGVGGRHVRADHHLPLRRANAESPLWIFLRAGKGSTTVKNTSPGSMRAWRRLVVKAAPIKDKTVVEDGSITCCPHEAKLAKRPQMMKEDLASKRCFK